MTVADITEAREYLGLPPFITQKEIKKRYLELSKEKHPDKGGSHDTAQILNKHYRVLLEYTQNFKFSFSEEEIKKQYPKLFFDEKFRT